MLVMVCFAIGVGVGCGAVIVAIIWLRRRHQIINSLTPLDRLVGMSGVVEIPFNHHSQGKVRVHLNDSVLNVRALTDEPKGFELGDRIVVMATQGNYVWVVSEQTFRT
jgi:membrane protein implicated in regulation of membrane protease activity